MNSKIAQLISLLETNERKYLLKLLIVATLSALLQLIAMISIIPFVAALANPELIQKNPLLNHLQYFWRFSNQSEMITASGVFIIVTLLLSNSMQALSVWQINKFSYDYGSELATRLLREYISRPYLFFVSGNSAVFIKNINDEVWRVVNGVLIPLLQTIAGLIKILFIVLLLLLVNVWATLGMTVFIGGSYLLIGHFVKGQLTRNGREISTLYAQRFKTVKELFEGVKEIKLLGHEHIFLSSFERITDTVVKHEVYGVVVGQLPRYFLEIITFGSLLAISIFLNSSENNSSLILPLIALFVIAGYRLMPAMQEVYGSFTRIKYALPAIDAIYSELITLQGRQRNSIGGGNRNRLPVNKNITLEKLVFTYPGANNAALNALTLELPAYSSVGLVGASGSGKSTLVDVLLGLLQAQSGVLQVDGVSLGPDNLREWQNNIGYVPQHIYLTDDTIARNIALGVPAEEIDMQAVEQAARAANLHDFIVHELPQGYHTEVGERGVRLSGGQRQRIGIARALYHAPSVLVLDEATSALDSVTEMAVMEAIKRLSGTMTTIMVAHRVSTLKECDVIHRMVAGEIVESGNYETLMASSAEFRKLANVSKNGNETDGIVSSLDLVG